MSSMDDTKHNTVCTNYDTKIKIKNSGIYFDFRMLHI